jgi:hypothetical protein
VARLRSPVPSSRFRTASTACSARSLRACCIPLPILRFITFPSREPGRNQNSACDFPAMQVHTPRRSPPVYSRIASPRPLPARRCPRLICISRDRAVSDSIVREVLFRFPSLRVLLRVQVRHASPLVKTEHMLSFLGFVPRLRSFESGYFERNGTSHPYPICPGLFDVPAVAILRGPWPLSAHPKARFEKADSVPMNVRRHECRRRRRRNVGLPARGVAAHLLSRTAGFVGHRPLVWLGDCDDCSPRTRSVSPEEVSESPRYTEVCPELKWMSDSRG